MEKAYDSVDFAYTLRVLEAVGVPSKFLNWVRMMFESGSTQLIINGYLSDRFHPGGGGKQGDPLYPLLFLVVMLGLIAIIDHDESIKGIPLPLCDRSVKIECFADDTSLFIGHHDDYHKYRSHITLFERASTMQTN